MRTLDTCSCGSASTNKWEKVLVDYIKMLGKQITEASISKDFISWSVILDNNSSYVWSALLDKTFVGQDWSKIKFDEETSIPVNWSDIL